MKIYFIFILLIISRFELFAQYSITIKNEADNLPLENVNCETSEKTNFFSNQEGIINLNFEPEFIILSHIGYESQKIHRSELKNNITIFLKIRAIELSETVVLPATKAKEIIQKVSSRQLSNYDQNFIRDYKINHLGLKNSFKVLSLTGTTRISRMKKEELFFVSELTSINRDYYIQKENYENNVFLSPIRIFSGYFIKNYTFFKNIKDYKYTISNNYSDRYIISFEPKENKIFSFSGIIEVSKSDYAVLSFKARLLPNEENIRKTILSNNKKSDSYLFLQEQFNYEFEKKGKSYILVNANYLNETKQINNLIKESATFKITTSLSKIDDQKNILNLFNIRTLEIIK